MNAPNPRSLYFLAEQEVPGTGTARDIFGGGCINDTTIHETTPYLPFGGAGKSGIGKYHGKASFDAFSHLRSIIKQGFLFDIKLRYPPYQGKLKFMRKIF